MTTNEYVQHRIESLGELGPKLLAYVDQKTQDSFPINSSLYNQFKAVYQLYAAHGTMTAVAASIILCKVPIQVPVKQADLLTICEIIIKPKKNIKNEKFIKNYYNMQNEKILKPYTVKKATGEGLKTNVWFSDVYQATLQSDPTICKRFQELSYYTIGWTNDRASSCIMASIVLRKYMSDPVEFVIRMINDPDGCKQLNVVIKSLGANASPLGAALCESVCLQGMPDKGIDLYAQVKSRLDVPVEGVIDFNPDELYAAVHSIIHEELIMEKYQYVSPEELWEKRWAWGVNGSHSRTLEHEEKKFCVGVDDERMYKRSAFENMKVNAIKEFSGRVYVSSSIKPEVGKPGRVIMACDTASYAAFHHLLGPVERAWRNRRILLDPGKGGQASVCARVRKLSRRGLSVMLDYDGFDCQHSLSAQKLVIQCIADYVGYDPVATDRLTSSFDNMILHCEGKRVGRAKFSLMSGHRGTTFINSLLNAAYIRMSLGDDWNKIDSLHTGDDVYAAVHDFDTVDKILDGNRRHNIRMNPTKQSIGFIASEFLRMSVNKTASYGYVMRAIGRCVSGNWEVSKVNDPGQSLSNWIGMGWTLRSRSMSDSLSEILSLSMSKSTGIERLVCRNILSGACGIDGTPTSSAASQWMGYNVQRIVEPIRPTLRDDYNNFATGDYLSGGLSDVERRVLTSMHVSVEQDMLTASYARNKHVYDQMLQTELLRVGKLTTVPIRRSVEFERLSTLSDDKTGVLLRYPILSLLRSRMTKEDVIDALIVAGEVPVKDYEVQAWGAEYGYNVVHGCISYSDACSVGKYVGNCAVYVRKPVFV